MGLVLDGILRRIRRSDGLGRNFFSCATFEGDCATSWWLLATSEAVYATFIPFAATSTLNDVIFSKTKSHSKTLEWDTLYVY